MFEATGVRIKLIGGKGSATNIARRVLSDAKQMRVYTVGRRL